MPENKRKPEVSAPGPGPGPATKATKMTRRRRSKTKRAKRSKNAGRSARLSVVSRGRVEHRRAAPGTPREEAAAARHAAARSLSRSRGRRGTGAAHRISEQATGVSTRAKDALLGEFRRPSLDGAARKAASARPADHSSWPADLKPEFRYNPELNSDYCLEEEEEGRADEEEEEEEEEELEVIEFEAGACGAYELEEGRQGMEVDAEAIGSKQVLRASTQQEIEGDAALERLLAPRTSDNRAT